MAERHPEGPQDSTAEGPPLDVLAQLTGGPRIDDVLSRAARRAPRRLALSGLRGPDLRGPGGAGDAVRRRAARTGR